MEDKIKYYYGNAIIHSKKKHTHDTKIEHNSFSKKKTK